MQQINPKLFVVASHDLHRTVSFYDVAIEMELESLTAENILQRLKQGAYRIDSMLFSSDSSANFSKPRLAMHKVVSWQVTGMLNVARSVRNLYRRWTA